MKARVKETGAIVEVEFIERKTHTGEQVYMTHKGCLIEESRLDFNAEPFDYWTRLEHTYAGMAMQGILSNEAMQQELMRVFGKEECIEDIIVDYAKDMALLLVRKMKEERK